MEHFVVSARKYRPATFDSVVGQSHVTLTLKNAIKNEHLAHAFLFCGPRGVGKTTCARILAKTINCHNIGPDYEACNQCESCLAFNHSGSFNIYELDAASNNSVDDIRGLVEQVRYAPQGAKYKIYIIDEVHMLSTAAFNAFLKTLEEPPAYAIFILATTEKHKILPTILSRCQIFDFKRIRLQDSVDHLKRICEKEGITAEEDALHVVAQKAEGALRDALSIFDRIVSFSGNRISYQDVIANLNILDYDYYFRISDLFLNQDLAASLLLFDEILSKGFDAHQFLVGMSEHMRNLLMCKDPSTVKLLEVSENVAQRYLEQSKKMPASFLLNALNVLNQFDLNYKNSKNQRLHVELCLMKLSHIQSVLNLKGLLEQAPDKKKTEPLTSAADMAGTATPPPAPPPPSVKLGSLDAIKAKMEEERIRKAEEEKKNAELAEEEVPVMAVDEKNLLLCLEKYRQKLGSLNKLSLSAIYKSLKVLVENNKVVLELSNITEMNQVEEDKIELLGFLKNELQNRSILIELRQSKNTSTEKTFFTARDKFDALAQENPALNELRIKLELDLD